MTIGVVWATFPTSSSICIIFLILAYDRITIEHAARACYHREFGLIFAPHYENERGAPGPGILPVSLNMNGTGLQIREFYISSLATFYETNI